ncbi:uncharacterized protein LOC132741562 [Ruditapes philippinarum]|uniref:uncharacterized protein LOC132741562 n=1 Tax=Ruditapes philippinarum TaxID=129788 RepID=UPI00295BA5FD|nr:uncharacterized protein LOC132741562 [Ruditapes philippinarum]
MFKLLAVCLFAFAIAKWKQNVQATGDLNAEEMHLLDMTEEGVKQVNSDSDYCSAGGFGVDERQACCEQRCRDMDCVTRCLLDQDKRLATGIQIFSYNGNGTEKRGSVGYMTSVRTMSIGRRSSYLCSKRRSHSRNAARLSRHSRVEKF